MKKKINIIFILIILICIYTFMCAYSYATNISNDLSNSVLRLHIIANSDSEEDQNLKYIVRDNLLKYMNTLCINCTSKEEVIELVKKHQEDFKKIAENTVKSQGFSYPINIEIGNFKCPTKTDGDVSFPSGYYDALEVKIGTSSGQNWWCVMFPPLCFVDTSSGIVPTESKEVLFENLSEEEYRIISDSHSNEISLKFKIIEFFKNM